MKNSINYTFSTISCLLLLALFATACKQNKALVIDSNTKMTSPPKVELVYQINSKLGEGAYWNHKTQEFWWIDIEDKKFYIFDPVTGKNATHSLPSKVGTVVPSSSGSAILATEEGIIEYALDTKDYRLISDVDSDIKTTRLNDGKCDPAGRLWVGSMDLNTTKPYGSLYSVDKGNVTKHLSDITISNGIIWTKNNKTMYYIDTPTGVVMAYDFDNKSGTISNGRTAVKVDPNLGYPDGMAIDENDNLWVCLWNGNAVVNFDPRTGKLIQKIEVPAHNVTSCAFGGPDLDILYITTATVDMSDEELNALPLSGSLFKCEPGVKGVKSSVYKL